jgi:hypothetical protein
MGNPFFLFCVCVNPCLICGGILCFSLGFLLFFSSIDDPSYSFLADLSFSKVFSGMVSISSHHFSSLLCILYHLYTYHHLYHYLIHCLPYPAGYLGHLYFLLDSQENALLDLGHHMDFDLVHCFSLWCPSHVSGFLITIVTTCFHVLLLYWICRKIFILSHILINNGDTGFVHLLFILS